MMPRADVEPAEAVTLNPEALWVLQALLDIPTLAPELRALPYGAARSTGWLAGDERVAALAAGGLLDGAGRAVIEPVARRLRALAAPDVEIVVLVDSGAIRWPGPIDVADQQTWQPSAPDGQLCAVLARREGRWTSAVRAGAHTTIDDLLGAVDPPRVGQMVAGLLDAVCPGGPSALPSMNLPLDELRDGLPARRVGVPAAAVAEFDELCQNPVAEAVVYARGYTDGRVSHSVCTLDVRATAAGRVCFHRAPSRPGVGRDWMTVAPAGAAQLGQGVRAVLGGVAVRDWDTHRRVG